ncbi:MAG: hypothetical protein Q7R81_05450 [Candidatus Peregrinibacteria bacterium]|nr:hypothetical protein [Candidatus Peregrinibacteria bacterium]
MNPKAISSSLKQRILGLLHRWFLTSEEERKWEKFLKSVSKDHLQKIHMFLEKYRKQPLERKDTTLTAYLTYYRSMRKQRRELLSKLARSAALKKQANELLASLEIEGQPLSRKQVEDVFSSDRKLAAYFASLTVIQIEYYKDALKSQKMDPAMKKTMLKFFDKLQGEALQNEKELNERVLPLATGIATAVKLKHQIDALEDLQRQLSV